MPCRRPLRAIGAVIAAAILFAACDSSDRAQSREPVRFDAPRAAARIRALGRIEVTGQARVAARSTHFGGRIQYRPYRVLEVIPVNVGSTLGQAQYRRIGGRAWVRRAVVVQPGLLSFGYPLLVFRGPQSVPFLAVSDPDRGSHAEVATPYDPARLLDVLGTDPSVHFVAGGRRRTEGTDAATAHAHLTGTTAAKFGLRDVTVWSTDSGLPVRIRVTTVRGLHSTYTIRRHATPVRVTSPPLDRIEVASRALPDATGPYVPVAELRAGPVPVTVSRAPGAAGWTCWQVQSEPAYHPIETPRPSGGVCVPPVTAAGGEDEAFAIPIDATGETPYELIGMLVPTGSTVTAVLVGGSEQPVPVTGDGIAVYAGPASPAAALITVTTPNGTELVCGPGPVNTRTDVAQITPQSAIADQPWNCLAKDVADLLAG